MLKHRRAVGDTLTEFAAVLQSGGVARNLTGKTVSFKMYSLAGALVTNAAATVDSPTTGEVSYDFQAADVDTEGTYKAWFVITDSTETDHYPDDDDGIEVTIFSTTADTVPETPTIDIVGMANAPIRTRTVEGTVEERSINELIRADQYTTSKDASAAVPWGMRLARTKPGGTVT